MSPWTDQLRRTRFSLFPWSLYSKKLRLRIETPYCGGIFTQEDADSRGMHFAEGRAGAQDEGNMVAFYWLVDGEDGVIIDARFQVYGDSALIGAAEIACELVVGKNYDQARRLSADLIDRHVQEKREDGETVGFPKETWSHINLVVEALESAAAKCEGISLAPEYVAPPMMNHEIEVTEGGWPGWDTLSLKQKLVVIEDVVAKEIRPYIEMDAGGIEVLNLIGNEVIIAYQGTCTSCHSATGATLSYIQHVLKAKVHPELIVTPNL